MTELFELNQEGATEHFESDFFEGGIWVFDQADTINVYTLNKHDEFVMQSGMSKQDKLALEHNYFKVAVLAPLYLKKFSSQLILGLGGGSLTRFYKHYYPDINHLAIDIDSSMIEIAHKYYNIPKDLCLQADAEQFVKENKTKYDNLIIDLFGRVGFLLQFSELSFLKNCKKSLSKNGVLMINICCLGGSNLNPMLKQTIINLKSIFTNMYVYNKGFGNIVLFFQDGKRLTQDEHITRAKELDISKKFNKYSAEATVREFYRGDELPKIGIMNWDYKYTDKIKHRKQNQLF